MLRDKANSRWTVLETEKIPMTRTKTLSWQSGFGNASYFSFPHLEQLFGDVVSKENIS